MITAIVLLMIGSLNYFLDANFENLVFSNTMLLSMGVYVFVAVMDIYQLVRFGIWRICANRKLKAGEDQVLSGSVRVGDWFLTGLLFIMLILMYLIKKDAFTMILPIGYLIILFGSHWILAKFRPDEETADLLRIGSVALLFVFYLVYFAVGLAVIDGKPVDTSPEVSKVTYSDLGVDYKERISDYAIEESSILGSKHYYSSYYGDRGSTQNKHLGYTLYRVEQDWIMDRFWQHQLDAAYNANRIDCTDLWDAQAAFVNDRYQYYVRYEDVFLILRLDGVTLDRSQVETILHLLGLR